MNKKLIRKMLTAAGGPLQLTPEELKYLEWSKMTPELKGEYRNNRINAELRRGPNITNFWEAFQTYIGNRDPENPHLQTGDVPNPGMRNPKLIIQGALKVKQVAQKAKTIAERAAKISDRVFDRQYQRAISSGNSKRVLAVRDLHFKGKTGNNLILTTYRSLLSNKRSESQGLNPYNDVRHTVKHEGYFSTSSKDVANTYKYEEDSPLFSIYTHMKNPYVVDANGRSWLAVEIFSPPGSTAKYGRTTDLIVKRVLSEGNNDGVIIKNIMDVGAKRANLNGASEIADDYITFPGRAKLKDAITYDNNGNIIPISQRDNFSIFDIRHKKGGKINMIEFLKNGSGIHIKKKNRGSFTRWCGGNVTEECIRRGKASSNPKIRKKATFADNARHFKHEQGGIIKAKEGFKWSDILNNSGLGNLFSLGIQAYSSNKIADNNLLIQDASLEMEKNKELLMVPQLANQMFPQMMGPINPENPNEKGGVYAKYLYGKLESMLNGQINLTYENKKRINRLQTQSLKDLNLMNVLSGVGDTVSSIASYIGNKKNSTTPTTSNYQLDSFWTNPSLSYENNL